MWGDREKRGREVERGRKGERGGERGREKERVCVRVCLCICKIIDLFYVIFPCCDEYLNACI